MSKLVATYAEGFFAVFTESRSGMQQRALIDIGDKVPTPKEMAELAGTLSDHWGWANVIEKSPKVTPKAIGDNPRPYTHPKRTGEPIGEERNGMIIAYLADHPQSDQRSILKGLGFEDSQARLARWHHAFSALLKANRVIVHNEQMRNESGHVYRKNLYSLP